MARSDGMMVVVEKEFQINSNPSSFLGGGLGVRTNVPYTLTLIRPPSPPHLPKTVLLWFISCFFSASKTLLILLSVFFMLYTVLLLVLFPSQ
jgi:hypothetical protein